MKIIRFYNEKGEHILSLVDEPVYCNEVDLASPDGDVEYCGVPRDLFETLSKHFIVETE
jgi:hypothetical protein